MRDELEAVIRGNAGWLALDRPEALNALSPGLVEHLARRLDRWRSDPAIAHVVLVGRGGRAFSAGADVRAMWGHAVNGEFAAIREYFRSEYALDLSLASYPKPITALVDGIAMGGGMALAVLSRFCLVTEAAVFAMPETLIGFFPDAGASWFLRRLPGRLGLYLGLTGTRLSGPDAVHLGLASHFVPRTRLGEAEQILAEHGPGGLDVLGGGLPPMSIAAELPLIDRLFAAPTLAGIFAALEAERSEWAGRTLATLRARSPAALGWTFELLANAQPPQDLEAALATELAQVVLATAHPDFREGVRAALIDKDKAPRWQKG